MNMKLGILLGEMQYRVYDMTGREWSGNDQNARSM